MKYIFERRTLAFSLQALVILVIICRSTCYGDALDDAMNKALKQFNIRGASVAYFDRVSEKTLFNTCHDQ